VVRDDVSAEPYPTMWEDFDWSFEQDGRMTTRLDRRPPAEATRLIVSVRAPVRVTESNGFTHAVASERQLASFEIPLPPDHAAPSH
jgi:hypothetical protein